jgi:hypothetical protein
LITDFLRPVLPAAQVQESVAGVTVEMEEPPQAVGVGAERVKRVVESGADRRSEPRHDGGAEPAGAGTETARLRAEAGNRRDKMRYACRLGAQVFRTGIAVPIHCCLTDLSTGGCYLEVSLPFAKGTSVEIIVHTHEIKLSLRGAVQASHPGFGMGIAFDLKTKDERDTVQKLTDFVVASAESAEEPENSENS